MVAGALERKRLGLTNKAMFVVPKATHRQFLEEAQELYPNARFLFPQPGDFTPENREAFLYRARTGDWDGIIVSGEQFATVPLTGQTGSRMVGAGHRPLQAIAARPQPGRLCRGPKTHTQAEGRRVRAAGGDSQIGRCWRRSARRGRTPTSERFEKLGVDAVFVDEAGPL